MRDYVLSVDQGTSSTRCMIVDREGNCLIQVQKEHAQYFPRPGWVEHDPEEILLCVEEVVRSALKDSGIRTSQIVALGITNQRETSVLWDKNSGKPLCRAVVWQDTRTDSLIKAMEGRGFAPLIQSKTGLPLSTYFSGPKIRWMIDHIEGVREKALRGEILFGTIDTWLIWHLTGGVHVTDPTNASRTMLMDLAKLQWDSDLLEILEVPRSILPEIRSSSEIYGVCRGVLQGVPVCGDLGDQQASLFGQACFDFGDVKNTYGTGCFALMNTGPLIHRSSHGMISTVAYQLKGAPPSYAIEGSVAVAGALVKWLRDNLEIIDSASEIESLARKVEDNGGVYIVPAFSGLYAPYWRSDARGVIVGLTGYATKAHLARAALEAAAHQSREVLDAMATDVDTPLRSLRVDGGMVANDLLNQIQSDILGLRVIRSRSTETTALGAAFCAGLAVGYWNDLLEIQRLRSDGDAFDPMISASEREARHAGWLKAVSRSLGWL